MSPTISQSVGLEIPREAFGDACNRLDPADAGLVPYEIEQRGLASADAHGGNRLVGADNRGLGQALLEKEFEPKLPDSLGLARPADHDLRRLHHSTGGAP